MTHPKVKKRDLLANVQKASVDFNGRNTTGERVDTAGERVGETFAVSRVKAAWHNVVLFVVIRKAC